MDVICLVTDLEFRSIYKVLRVLLFCLSAWKCFLENKKYVTKQNIVLLLLIYFTRLLFHVSNLGVSTCHFAWAFHSEAEEELINMIPAIQRGDPQWSELRAMGIGWWVRNVNTLRRCIEKVTLFHWILKDCHFPFFLLPSLLNSCSLFV